MHERLAVCTTRRGEGPPHSSKHSPDHSATHGRLRLIFIGLYAYVLVTTFHGTATPEPHIPRRQDAMLSMSANTCLSDGLR